VLRQVDGDFVAEVTIPGEVAPRGARTAHWLPYHGAGLLVWLDRDNYIRLERAAIVRGNSDYHYINLELTRNAMLESSSGVATPSGVITLRLERKGSRISASYRNEDQVWMGLPKPLGIRTWGNSLKVGVAAVNTATDTFAATLEGFRVGPDAN
jgi:regulation of enolase protein 1 (concanavalin A-like superfamily)